MRPLVLHIIVGLVLAGCGPESPEDSGDTPPTSTGSGTTPTATGTPSGSRWLGTHALTDVAVATLLGLAKGDLTGDKVALIPDTTGDGRAELLIGAKKSARTDINAGVAYVVNSPFSGTIGLDTQPTLLGSAYGDFLGGSIDTTADLTGDGFSDVILGAKLHGASGGVWVLSGLITENLEMTDAHAKFTGGSEEDHLGGNVRAIGDLNRDGTPDLAMTAKRHDNPATDAGVLYVQWGPIGETLTDLSVDADVRIFGEYEYDFFGSTLGSAGDITGDGQADLVATAGESDQGGENAGRVYIWNATPEDGSSASEAWCIIDGLEGQRIGYVNPAGDLNGDGRPDLGISSETGGAAEGGIVYWVTPEAGQHTIDTLAWGSIESETQGTNLGSSFTYTGDLDSDGFDDMAVSAPFSNGSGGTVYLYYGPLSGSLTDADADARFLGSGAAEALGHEIDAGLDATGDAIPDLLFGADGGDGLENGAGRVYLLSGAPAP